MGRRRESQHALQMKPYGGLRLVVMRPPSAHPSPLRVIPHFPQQDARQTFGAAVRPNPGLLKAPFLVADPHCAHAPTSMGVRNGEILTVESLAVFRLDADRKRASHFDPRSPSP